MAIRAVRKWRGRVRFDDKLATVLAQPLDNAAGRAIAWRQIIDLLAQRRATGDDPLSDEARDVLRSLRGSVPAHVRAEAALAVSGRPVSADLVALIADEPPAIAAPLLSGAMLTAEEWLRLIPRFSPSARALLRHRRDLPDAVMQALASFGAADFALDGAPAVEVLPPAVASAAAESSGDTQIRDLLARIAAYRTRGTGEGAGTDTAAEAASEEGGIAESFRFETGADGVILWVDGIPRGPVIGATIASVAESLDHGVDGHAAGAFRRRAPFRDARMTLPGGGPGAGEWRISGVPFFETATGAFQGYRGTARRPRAGESAAPVEGGLYGSGLAPDSLRQLVHELRTPLNAIIGFAEMIERQVLGPAARGYRARADDIIAQGRRLLEVVDDLDTAARSAAATPLPEEASFADVATLLAGLHERHEPVAAERGVRLDFRIATGLPHAEAEPAAVERMCTRLLAATIGLAQPGETIIVRLERPKGDTQLRLSVSRPHLLSGRDERALLDPGYSPDGDWPDAPVLGLGFALRLIRNLAAGIGGSLDIRADAFHLRLPPRGERAMRENG
jgi:hypothetical protein